MLGGEPHGRVLRAVALVPAVPLDEFEEDAADGLGVAVAELAVRVTVVEDAECAIRLQLAVGELEPCGQVVVVVRGDGQQPPPAARKARAAATTSSVVRAMCWARAMSSVGAGPTLRAIRTVPSSLVTGLLRNRP